MKAINEPKAFKSCGHGSIDGCGGYWSNFYWTIKLNLVMFRGSASFWMYFEVNRGNWLTINNGQLRGLNWQNLSREQCPGNKAAKQENVVQSLAILLLAGWGKHHFPPCSVARFKVFKKSKKQFLRRPKLQLQTKPTQNFNPIGLCLEVF